MTRWPLYQPPAWPLRRRGGLTGELAGSAAPNPAQTCALKRYVHLKAGMRIPAFKWTF